MIYSEKYAQDIGAFYGYNVTYMWSNPNVDPQYYQSYATTGEASIDPSIFQIIRPNDPWSLGANFSFWSNSDGSGWREPYWECVSNNYKKNVDVMTKLTVERLFNVMANDSSAKNFYNDAKYSPDAISYSLDYSQRFLRDYDYNSLVLLPKFWFVYWSGGSWGQVEGSYLDALNAYNQHPDGLVMELSVTVLYGDRNSEAVSSRSGLPFTPFIQFAGTVPVLKYNTSIVSEAVYRDGYSSGVFLGNEAHSGTSTFRIYSTPGYYADTNKCFNQGGGVNTFIIPFSSDLLVRHHLTNSNDMRYGMTLEDAALIIDRLGYNWAKSNEAGYFSKTGSWCTDPDIRCPVIDPETNTVTTVVNEGVNISDYAINNPDSNYNWGSGDPEFDGPTMIQVVENTNPVQSTTEPTEEIDLNEPVLATTGGNSAWIVNQQKIDEFFLWLWNPDGTIFDDIVKGCALLGENPMDSVVSLKVFPIDLSGLQRENRIICFGRVPSQVNASLLTGSNLVNIDLGSFYFNDSGMFNDFRDYEPYSDYSLYIPFVGVIPLQAVECINTTISVKMIVDLVVGSCTAVIFTNGVPYKYIDGQIGIDMPVTGRNLASYGQTILAGALAGIPVSGKVAGAMSSSSAPSNIVSSSSNLIKSGAGNLQSAIGQGPFPAISASDAMVNAGIGALKVGMGEAAIGASVAAAGLIGAAPIIAGAAIPALLNNPQPQTAGCNAPATGLSKPLYPYFIVRRSDCWIPDNYNKLYGRPVQKGGKISDFHGFCKFGNLCLDGIDATEVEKTMINDILQNGVII